MSSPININNLSFCFDSNNMIFAHLSLSIPTSSLSLLTGPSGSGKSTFLKLLAKLYPNYGGKKISGEIKNLPHNWGMIFQDPDKQFTMSTPKEEFIFTLENLNLEQKEAQKRITNAVKQSNISTLLNRKFTTLSGGEKQRVAFAIILAMQPELILLDEPFANCDPDNRDFLIKQLINLKQKNITIILSDHDLVHYKKLVDQVYWCENKTISSVKFEDIFKPSPNSFHLKQTSKTSTPILKLKNFSLSTQNIPLITKNNLSLYAGATLLTGKNGSGKSTFFKALTKMFPYNGQIFFENKDINKLKNKKYLIKVGQVFQNSDNQFLMVTVKEELKFSLAHCHNPLFRHKTINDLLKLVNLINHQDQVVYSLSGGQKKKLQVLVMILANPNFLLLDEPFAGVDKTGQQQIINLLKNYYLNQTSEKKGLILISHQLYNLNNFFNYHLAIKNKNLVYLQGEE